MKNYLLWLDAIAMIVVLWFYINKQLGVEVFAILGVLIVLFYLLRK